MKKNVSVLVVLILSLIGVGLRPGNDSPGVKILTGLEKLEKYLEVNRITDVKKEFNRFIKRFAPPTSAGQSKDGTFLGESIYDNYKYKHAVTLVIKNGTIISVEYDEVKKDGKGKKKDTEYNKLMKKGSGAAPEDAYAYYEKMLIKTQDLTGVDGFSGASYSLYRFQTAVIRALLKAERD
jgi:major membrane immunogen (membrane-anchored lipoprotein)